MISVQKPAWIRRAEVVQQPVVERLQTLQAKVSVRQPGVRSVHHLGVHDGGVDAVRLHVFDVRSAVVVAWPDFLPDEAARCDADTRARIDGPETMRQADCAFRNGAIQAPAVTAIFAPQDTWRLVLVVRRQPVDEEVWRLENVIVRGNHTIFHVVLQSLMAVNNDGTGATRRFPHLGHFGGLVLSSSRWLIGRLTSNSSPQARQTNAYVAMLSSQSETCARGSYTIRRQHSTRAFPAEWAQWQP
jgi:hypothetical protein